jgi:hypothetical protein
MATQAEKLNAGIDSLTWRIAALAERLPNESSNRGDDPRATVRQINEYTRAKRALQAELDVLSVGTIAQSDDSPIVNKKIKVQDHTKSEDVTARQSWWKSS